ncbi:hypothetical protein J4558_23080 [Leptolyngbya sp. 15MV]|nr:hypothetical protein J4558_23080 [Leptolyngbya sp. 15MV]
MTRGRFIALEGGEGSGKSTHARLLAQALRDRGIACVLTRGLNISARKITVSTVGLPKAIERLAEEMELPITLALSLHAPRTSSDAS